MIALTTRTLVHKTMTCTAGYHQIPIHLGDEYIRRHSLHAMAHMNFMVMPFGLTNAPATFQTAMNALVLRLA